jgi:hypothetical protein
VRRWAGDGQCCAVLLALGTRRGFVGRSSLPPPASGESTSLNLDRWTTLFPPSMPLTNYCQLTWDCSTKFFDFVDHICVEYSIIDCLIRRTILIHDIYTLVHLIKVVLPQQPPAYRWRRRSSATELACLRHGQHSIRSPAGDDGTSLRGISPHISPRSILY